MLNVWTDVYFKFDTCTYCKIRYKKDLPIYYVCLYIGIAGYYSLHNTFTHYYKPNHIMNWTDISTMFYLPTFPADSLRNTFCHLSPVFWTTPFIVEAIHLAFYGSNLHRPCCRRGWAYVVWLWISDFRHIGHLFN